MPIYKKDGRTILFIHIPKCGGSSVDAYLKRLGYTCFLEMRDLPIQDSLQSSPQHYTADILEKLVSLENITETFAIVRNPFDRLRSEYVWTYRNASSHEVIPSFESWIKDSIKQCKINSTYLDNHIRPMVDFFSKSIPCKIFRHESGLRTALEFITRDAITGRVDMPHQKDSRKVASLGASSDIELSKKSKQIILDFYRADFETFLYPSNYLSLDSKLSKSSPTDQEAYRRYLIETYDASSQLLLQKLDLLRNLLSEQSTKEIQSITRHWQDFHQSLSNASTYLRSAKNHLEGASSADIELES